MFGGSKGKTKGTPGALVLLFVCLFFLLFLRGGGSPKISRAHVAQKAEMMGTAILGGSPTVLVSPAKPSNKKVPKKMHQIVLKQVENASASHEPKSCFTGMTLTCRLRNSQVKESLVSAQWKSASLQGELGFAIVCALCCS